MPGDELKIKHVYCVSAHTDDGESSRLAGIYADKRSAIEAVVTSGPHDIWEFYYSYVSIEKYRFNSLGHPCILAKGERERIEWLQWEYGLDHQQAQSGKYVPCARPQWAERTFGFA